MIVRKKSNNREHIQMTKLECKKGNCPPAGNQQSSVGDVGRKSMDPRKCMLRAYGYLSR